MNGLDVNPLTATEFEVAQRRGSRPKKNGVPPLTIRKTLWANLQKRLSLSKRRADQA
jgi:hypothetical protein